MQDQIRRLASLMLTFFTMVIFTGVALAGSKYAVIYRFPGKNRGYTPYDLIADGVGNLYGTTAVGGTHDFGTVYQLSPADNSGSAWIRSVLYSFRTGSTCCFQRSAGAGSLILDPAGNLYGVTAFGGHGCSAWGCGTVFKLAPPKQAGGSWTETTLYVFSDWDGYEPGGLALDPAGNLYGATFGGGRRCSAFGCGTVFKLTPPKHGKLWTRTVIYFFKGVPGSKGDGDGASPLGVTFDQQGNLFGVTRTGGHCDQGVCYGTAFELKPPTRRGSSWTETILYRFGYSYTGQLDSGVILDKSGALYGSTEDAVYQVVNANGIWTENVLTNGASYYYNGVILDSFGNLYGTTGYSSQYQHGTVFQLSPPGKGGNWTETVLHAFADGRDGANPESGVTFGKDGMLYGSTAGGGDVTCQGNDGCGTVFTVAP